MLIQCKKRKQTKHSDWSMIKETHRRPIKSFAFKSKTHTLDGAIIDDVIFPDCMIGERFYSLNMKIFFMYNFFIVNK